MMSQTKRTKEKHGTGERGISLIIVLLVGMLMLLTAVSLGTFAVRSIQSMNARSNATQTLYTAEQSFECVKYWLNKDYRHFSTIGGTFSHVAECNNTVLNFDTDPNMTYVGGVGRFTVSTTLGGEVDVEVERTNPSEQLFDGHVNVFSRSTDETNKKATERYQRYHYRVLKGADIMFVVDRSGSIDDGGDRNDRTLNTEWNEMLDALNSTIRLLSNEVPSPYIGIVSFGSDAYDTGVIADDCSVADCNWRQPDHKLTDAGANITTLIDENGTPADTSDDVPYMNLDKASTNLSLGISIAGSELMGKYYPHTGLRAGSNLDDPQRITFGVGKYSGEFERIVASNIVNGFDDLPDQVSPNERPDTEYPDVIVVITDGEPNGIMTHIADEPGLSMWYQSAITGGPLYQYISPVRYSYRRGESKLFRTSTGGSGAMIIDDMLDVVGTPNLLNCHNYTWCNDRTAGGTHPDEVFLSGQLAGRNKYPRQSMCNTTLIAEKLKDDANIIIVGIYVGDDETTDAAVWMRDYFVSTSAQGDPLFAMVTEYGEIEDALMYLFEQLDFIQSR